MSKQFKDKQEPERHGKKVAEKQNLEKRKSLRDRHYHVIDEDEDDEETKIENRYAYLLKGM